MSSWTIGVVLSVNSSGLSEKIKANSRKIGFMALEGADADYLHSLHDEPTRSMVSNPVWYVLVRMVSRSLDSPVLESRNEVEFQGSEFSSTNPLTALDI